MTAEHIKKKEGFPFFAILSESVILGLQLKFIRPCHSLIALRSSSCVGFPEETRKTPSIKRSEVTRPWLTPRPFNPLSPTFSPPTFLSLLITFLLPSFLLTLSSGASTPVSPPARSSSPSLGAGTGAGAGRGPSGRAEGRGNGRPRPSGSHPAGAVPCRRRRRGSLTTHGPPCRATPRRVSRPIRASGRRRDGGTGLAWPVRARRPDADLAATMSPAVSSR